MSAPGDACIRCAGCARAYEPAAWQSLEPVRTLTDAEVSVYVLAWPRGRRIEVRACRCGRALARLAVAEPLAKAG